MKGLLYATLLSLVLAGATSARAGEDLFAFGSGKDGPLVVSSGDVVINRYCLLTGTVNAGDTTIGISDPAGYAPGDLVLIVRSTTLDVPITTGDPSGTNIESLDVGRFEVAKIASIDGQTLHLTLPLLYHYTGGVTQIVNVPEYSNVTVASGARVIPFPWNGTTGGIVAMLVSGTATIDGAIDVSGFGLHGGVYVPDTTGVSNCSSLDELAPTGAQRGEGLATGHYGPTHTGRGNATNGGGGGVCLGTGGGGGGHRSRGGDGGTNRDVDFARRAGGLGGAPIDYDSPLQETPDPNPRPWVQLVRLLMGGGGGAGHGTSLAGSSGGNGGGIIWLRTLNLIGSGMITCRGASATDSVSGGGGGGGAGGTMYCLFTTGGNYFANGGGHGGSTLDINAGGGGGGSEGMRFVSHCGSTFIDPYGGRGGYSSAPFGAGSAGGSGKSMGFWCPGTAPSASITSPIAGTTRAERYPTFKGTATGSSHVSLFVDGVLRRTCGVQADQWSCWLAEALPDGEHTVVARPEFLSAYAGPPSSPVTFSLDKTPPTTPVIEFPTQWQVLTDRSPRLRIHWESGVSTHVDLDFVPIYDGVPSSSAFEFGTSSLALGRHTVGVISTDEFGNWSAAYVDFFVIDPGVPHADFDGNASSDILLRNRGTGQNAIWKMNGTAFTGIADLPGVSNDQIVMAGTADFDMDGDANDIVLRNAASGGVAFWIMQGTSVAEVRDLPLLPTALRIEGTGDFNGDLRPDLILRNTVTGSNALWILMGTYVTIVDLPALPNANYSIESAGDFDGDGDLDLVWRNGANGSNALWLMNGTALQGIVDLPALSNTNYRIDAVSDFNHDGHPDLLWRNYADGRNAIWLMNGTSFMSIVDLPALSNTSYEICGPR
jgi:large repetitive protein